MQDIYKTVYLSNKAYEELLATGQTLINGEIKRFELGVQYITPDETFEKATEYSDGKLDIAKTELQDYVDDAVSNIEPGEVSKPLYKVTMTMKFEGLAEGSANLTVDFYSSTKFEVSSTLTWAAVCSYLGQKDTYVPCMYRYSLSGYGGGLAKHLLGYAYTYAAARTSEYCRSIGVMVDTVSGGSEIVNTSIMGSSTWSVVSCVQIL